MVNIKYIEKAGEFLGNWKVTQTDGSVVDIYLPKPIMDLIKAAIQDGSMNIASLLSRTANIVKDI